MISKFACPNCNSHMDTSWVVCPNCGTITQKDMINCVRCYQMIPVNSKYCTFCSYEQVMIGNKIKQPKVNRISAEIEDDEEISVSRILITTSLKFDTNGTGKIVSSTHFTRTALMIILISGLSLAFTILSMGAIFGQSSDIRNAIRLFITISCIEISALLSITLFTNMQFKAIGVPTTYNMNLRYFGISGILLILKDLFMYPSMLYILVFEGESGFDMATGVYITTSALVLAYLAIHTISYYRYITGYGLGINILFFVMTLVLSYLMIVFCVEMILAIVDMI